MNQSQILMNALRLILKMRKHELKKVLQIFLKKLKYLFFKGNVYKLQKKWNDALKSYNECLKINPKFSFSWFNKGSIFL